MAHIQMSPVPYKGGGPAMIDVMGGRTHMVFGSIPSTITHLHSGKLRAVGVGATQRSELLPDVPTVSESGLPGYEAANWIGIVAPAGTPPAVVALLHKEISAMQKSPEVVKQFTKQGAAMMQMTSDQFAKFIASETAKWGRVVKEAGIKAQ